MKIPALTLKLFVMGLLFSGGIQDSHSQNINRSPVVAGRFYPGNSRVLEETLGSLFSESKKADEGTSVQALIAPHAGYTFSGGIAAAAFNQTAGDAEYENIFILASSHHVNLGKASIYNIGNYETPLGEAKVNLEVANNLISKNDCFTFNQAAHQREHSVEVQVPFIQYHFKSEIPIVPIVLGTQVPEICEDIANALKPWFNEKNLFVISADFSHYPSYTDANKVDKLTADALCSGLPEKFLSTIKSNSEMRVPGLATSMCAWPAGLVLLYLAEDRDDLEFRQVMYKNSGDSKLVSDRSEVVGYHAISLVKKDDKNSFSLSHQDKKTLLEISRETIDTYISKGKKPAIDKSGFSDVLELRTGAFVSLKKEGKLRGCIGSFRPNEPLYSLIQSLTIASAVEDTRFLPVQQKELKEIDIEISVLTPMQKIDDINEIQLGKHGIYISKNGRTGTFLPQVATETGWKLEEFLGRCARDKARIGWEGWKDADIYIYEALVFKEKN